MLLPAMFAEQTGSVAPSFPRSLKVMRKTRAWPEISDALSDADVVVLQRPSHNDSVAAIPFLQRRGIAVVVDLDDDFGAVHASHPSFAEMHPKANPVDNWHNTKRACQLADMVTVTTPALAARYGALRARVIPNYVPASLLEVTAPRDGRTVGWGGSTLTHVVDLAAARGGVAMAIADADARFLLVGGELDEAQHQLHLPAPPDTTGYIEFPKYHSTIAQLDVGIVPLADSRFNRAKSALKGLEYAALGIPFVASETPDYVRIQEHGIGVIADGRSRDWRRKIRQLLVDQAFRAETAERAREAVIQRHLFQTNGWRWAEAWHEAVTIRRSKAVAA